MMRSMGFRLPARVLCVASLPLAAVIVAACAEGSDADPDGPGLDDADAATLEASSSNPRSDSGTDPEPEEDAGAKDSGPKVSAACTAALDEAKWDFEGSDQGWTHVVSDNAENQASWPFDPWTRGTASTIPCPDGQCWGAERNQNYPQCGRGELISPKIDLSACKGETIVLAFTHAYAFWTGTFNSQTWFDGGILEISKDDGATWEIPSGTYPGTVKILGDRSGYKCVLPNAFHVHGKSGFTGVQQTAATFEIELPAAWLTDKMRIRFSQASGVSSTTTDANQSRSGTAAGWRVDDVRFAAK